MNVLHANTTPLSIQIGLTRLTGDLYTPLSSTGLVLFVHGSGSSRLSPRNRYVAEILYQSKISSLLFDLLTPEEDLDYQNRLDISVLADRLDKVYDWVQEQYPERERPIGLFGASTGAAAALQVAAKRGQGIAAVVSPWRPTGPCRGKLSEPREIPHPVDCGRSRYSGFSAKSGSL